MKIAIIADWLVTYGGAEHVLAELHALFPDAPIFTTVAKRDALGPLRKTDIRTTRLQRLYSVIGNHQVLLPLMPRAIEDIDLTGFDVIISSSHAVAKGIVPPSNALHICYCHTPMRYAWEMEEDYLRDFRIPTFLLKRVKQQLARLRRWDLTTALRTDVFIANSTTTQERIKRIYGRESIVIGPPVEERFFAEASRHLDTRPLGHQVSKEPSSQVGNHGAKDSFLALGRLVPYKRFDLLIEVANILHIPLTIAGTGQDEARLRKLAGPTVTFLGYVPDEALPQLYRNARALLFPQYEDAGIVPLEAQACGTPIIAYAAGGALDSVEDGMSGVFFREQSVASIREALERFETLTFDAATIQEHARQFSQEKFKMKIMEEVMRSYNDCKGRGVSMTYEGITLAP